LSPSRIQKVKRGWISERSSGKLFDDFAIAAQCDGQKRRQLGEKKKSRVRGMDGCVRGLEKNFSREKNG